MEYPELRPLPIMPILPSLPDLRLRAGLLFASQRLFRKQQGSFIHASQGRPDRENLETICRSVHRFHPGRNGQGRRACGRNRSRGVKSLHDSHLHGRMLLPQNTALPTLHALRRHLRALLPEDVALPAVHALRRHLRSLLLQAASMSLPAHRAAAMLQLALLRRRGAILTGLVVHFTINVSDLTVGWDQIA